MSNLDDYNKLVEEVWRHNKLYYIDHAPEISDEEFDFLLKKLEKMEKEHPEWVTSSSPTKRVMESLTEGFKTITHKVPMLSLANTYSRDEVALFIKRMDKLTGHSNHTFSVELKMDGIAISATYVRGHFVQGVTRGDGQKGDDITSNLRTLLSLPLQLSKEAPEFLEIRGEVFMPHQEFKRLNQLKKEADEPLYANPRNAAAGSLKMLDPRIVSKRGLACVFYGIAQIEGKKLHSQFEVHEYLRGLGLPVLKEVALCSNIDEIFTFAEKVRAARDKLPFDIDGIVIKLNHLKEQEMIGSAGKHPRYACAYKFAAEQAQTKILDITVQIGRTGVLTPVAELVPVFLSGSLIARATLHNQEEVMRKDIRIGDTVTIEKGGDVIPKVVKVNLEMRLQEAPRWEMPKRCPSCGTQVASIEGEVAIRCPNHSSCPEQMLRRIIYFAGRDAFDIENLGEKVAEELFEKGYIKTPADLFILTKEQLATLNNFKEKSINNLLTSIEKAKHVSLDRFIMGLGIKHIGMQNSELLAIKSQSMEKLMQMTKEDFLTIEGIGDKVADAIIEYFKMEENRDEVKKLLSRGVVPHSPEPPAFENHPFNGKTFVITGTLEKYTRQEAGKLIKDRGGKVSESVSKKTHFLLYGHDAGSKLEKAKQLHIPLLTEVEFLHYLEKKGENL